MYGFCLARDPLSASGLLSTVTGGPGGVAEFFPECTTPPDV